MLLNKKNLENVLISERAKIAVEIDVLNAVSALLSENENERNLIKKQLHDVSSTKSNKFIFDLLETDKIFSINEIKNVCVDYRLRFLESHLYKNEIPEEAISKIRLLEKNHTIQLKNLMIVAPSKAFHLLNYDDPLLFAPIGNDYFYLIHKWGNDINPLRKLMVKPIKNMWNFVITSLIISLGITFLIPTNNLSKSVPLAPVIIFLFTFKSIIAVFLYFFFMVGKNFNEEIWKRKYYNN